MVGNLTPLFRTSGNGLKNGNILQLAELRQKFKAAVAVTEKASTVMAASPVESGM